ENLRPVPQPVKGLLGASVVLILLMALASLFIPRQPFGAYSGNMVVFLTIARYSAAITSGLRHAGDCRRGGIAGRWTKPVAAPSVCDVASEVRSLSQPQLGELYPGSLVAANVD